VMEFNLESSLPPADRPVIQEKIFSNIQKLYPDLWKNHLLGIFRTEFNYHSPGSLRVNRKMLRLTERGFSIKEKLRNGSAAGKAAHPRRSRLGIFH
jgi:hypothetical protein